MPQTPLPRRRAPELSLALLNGESWDLHSRQPENFTLITFYRGLHCPVCKSYLQTLYKLREDYASRGIDVVAVSMDSQARARKSRMDWEIGDLPLAFEMDAETASTWGLYLSEGIKEGEPTLFSEPGLFLVDPDGALYYAAINSEPWGRPDLHAFLKGIDFVLENDYPARGEAEAFAVA